MPPDFSRNVHCLLGLPFDAVNLVQAEQLVRSAATKRTPCFFSTPNLNFLIACQTDTAFRDSVLNSDLSVADGTPVVWIARLLGIPIPERVSGSDLFERLRTSTSKPLRVYFFGGMAGVAEAAYRKLNEDSSGLTCVGFDSAGFGSIQKMSDERTIAKINATQADFVVVSLGARKGQAWIEHNRHRLQAPVISHLGAVVNFVAGTVSRAPALLQRLGLEWLWRIKEEPVLWRRYFNDGLALLGLLSTRVLPCMFWQVLYKPSQSQLAAALVSLHEEPRHVRIHLAGAWSQQTMAQFRLALDKAVSMQKNLVIDMAEVIHVDSAFIGLLMLVFGYQERQGLSLKLISTSKPIRRIFKYSCAEYLCTQHV